MPQIESPLDGLSAFIPDNCLPEVVAYLQQYKVHLTITRERTTILGNYRNRIANKNHRITVNGNLNKYSFLITLLHELGHLLAYERFGHTIAPHGTQWKNEYAKILSGFMQRKIFPADIESVLIKTLSDPSASSCADIHLTRVLKKYDVKKDGAFFIEDLSEGSLFKIKGGRIFIKQLKIKKRYKCVEVTTGKTYLFSPVYEVELIKKA